MEPHIKHFGVSLSCSTVMHDDSCNLASKFLLGIKLAIFIQREKILPLTAQIDFFSPRLFMFSLIFFSWKSQGFFQITKVYGFVQTTLLFLSERFVFVCLFLCDALQCVNTARTTVKPPIQVKILTRHSVSSRLKLSDWNPLNIELDFSI